MNTKLVTTQVQKPILAPAMQQSIAILMLPLLELQTAIDQELQDNPLLEIDEESQKEDDRESQIDKEIREQIDRLIHSPDFHLYENRAEEEFPEDRNLKCVESLEESLLHQLRIEFSDPLHLKIGELIIGNINEDGYLTATLSEIAKMAETSDLDLLEKILRTIQHFEPNGIAARDLKECLLAQLTDNTIPHLSVICQIISYHLPELGQRKYNEIAKRVNIPIDLAKKIGEFIATLDPKPARNYRPIRSNIYIKPDIFIMNDKEIGYQVHVNDEDIPILRINSAYKNMLKQATLKATEKIFIREKLQNAIHFLKSIEQRGQTIKEIAKIILEKQKEFFEQGHSALVPMTLKDVAQKLQRNESTISRAIANKYIATPRGLYPMKFFFSHGIASSEPSAGNGQQTVSNRSIQKEIKDLIDSEDKANPLSDQDIQNYFSTKGMKIARRTISKYRQILDILPSYLRKQQK